MKRETYAKKLAALLGIEDVLEKETEKKKNQNKVVAVSESEIDKARQAQGILYFLQAPDLFQPKVCPHCGESFLVSRRFVKCCSYTCIAKELEAVGIKWSRIKEGTDQYEIDEEYIKRIYEGNEPIWVRNLDLIQTLLEKAKPPVEV